MKVLIRMVAFFAAAQFATAARYEAESANVISSGSLTASTGASGGYYVDGNNGFNITWDVTVTEGNKDLSFRISSPSGTRSMGVFVNGVKVGIVSATTSSWQTVTVTVVLLVGANTVELRDSEGTAEHNVDYLDVEPPPSSSLEAEGMDLTGYTPETFAGASGGGLVRLTTDHGSVMTRPSGIVAGTYDIGVRYFDESDGACAFRVFVNNVLVDAWTADQQLGHAGVDSTSLARRVIRSVPLAPGDLIRIDGYQNGGEYARLDRIYLSPSAPANTVNSMQWNVDGSIASLILDGVEHINPASASGMDLRIFDGFSTDVMFRDKATTRNSIVELTDTTNGYVRCLLRVESYDHHLAVRMIDLEGVPRNDTSLNFRLKIPYLSSLNSVALDSTVTISSSGNTRLTDWKDLGTRGLLVGGGVALYRDGTPAENQAALDEIQLIHLDPSSNGNSLPVFFPNPISSPSGNAGTLYAGSIAGAATDTDGDAPSYSKLSGPAWLEIAPDGTLSGTPGLPDIGVNTWVVQADDGFGGTSTAILNINVVGHLGLVAEWPMNEGSGQAVADVSGHGFHGTVAGATWTSGVSGGALDFNPSNDTVWLPVEAFATIKDQITIAMWVFGDTTQPRNDSVFYARNAEGGRVLNIHLPYGGANPSIYWDAGLTDTGYDRISNPVTTPGDYKGKWNHWVFTKNSNTGFMRIYRNGVPWHSGQNKVKSMAGIASAAIGSQIDSLSYDGRIDEVVLYDVELAQEEVTALYQSYSGFAGWTRLFSGMTGMLFDADLENDGIDAGIEYVLNGSPLVNDPLILPRLDRTSGNLVFTFNRLVSSVMDTAQVFQYGSELTHWSDLNITEPKAAEVVLGDSVDGVQTVTVTLDPNVEGGGKLFARLKVIRLPSP